MAEFKLVIGTKEGKCYQKEVKEEPKEETKAEEEKAE